MVSAFHRSPFLMADLSHIPEELRSLAVPVERLTPDLNNAVDHDERNLDVIRESMKRFGQDQLLVVQKQGMIVRKGNGRLTCAKELGWTHVAVLVVDESDVDAAARALADNRSSELNRWNFSRLSEQLAALKLDDWDLDELGWGESDLDKIAPAKPPDEFPECDEDIETEHVCPKCGYQYSGGETRVVGEGAVENVSGHLVQEQGGGATALNPPARL